MKKRVVVEFVSSIDHEKKKWYQVRKLYTGTKFAEKIQAVIDDYDHKGFRLLRTEQAYVDGSVNNPNDSMVTYASSTPLGLLLFFESYD